MLVDFKLLLTLKIILVKREQKLKAVTVIL